MNPSRNLTIRLAATALLLTAVAGCSDDGEPGAEPTPSTSSPSETDSSAPDEPTDAPSESVSPASGDVVEYRQFSFTAPQGWKVRKERLFVRSIKSPPAREQERAGEPFGFVTVSAGPALEMSLPKLAREQVANAEGERVKDVDLDGETVFHVAKPDQTFETNEVYGLWLNGEIISVRFTLIDSTIKKRQALIDSVLATWEWRQ